MPLSIQDLNIINLKNQAIPGKKYYGTDGRVYVGTKEGRLLLEDKASETTFEPTSSISETSVQGAIESISNTFAGNAQNAVGSILADTATIDLVYTPSTPSITANLKNTTVTAGVYGSALNVPQITIDAQGRITNAVNVSITAVTSVGLSMPSAFTVTNSPVTSSGTLTVTGAGTTSQYIDGTGALQSFPGSSYIKHGTASGTDTYTTTISGVTAYNDGDSYLIKFTNGNTTGCTLNINSLGAVDLYRNNDGPLLGGDIHASGEMLCVYISALNQFQCIGTSPNSLLAYVTNADSVAITKGMPVYAFGGQGDRVTVKRAKNTGDSTSAQTIGLVMSTSIGVNQKGFIMVQGLLDGLSILPTSTWTDGDPVYLGATEGTITNVKPYAPNHLVYLGFVTTANNGSAGRLYVRPQNGYELDEIHDVDLKTTPPSTNDVLVYNGVTKLWVNKTIAAILGYTPANQSITISTSSPLSGGGDLSANRTLSISQSTTSTDGYLSSTDWNTFNNKIGGSGTTNEIAYFTASSTIASLTTATYPSLTELSYVKGVTSSIQTQLNGKEPTLTKGNLTESTSSVLTITGGTGSVIGSGTTIQVKQASALQSGYLSSTDWSTFNGKQDVITLTTTGTSGAATFSSNTLNIPQYQAALTNPITGTGVSGQVAYFNGTTTLTGNNNFFWDITNGRLGLRTTTPGGTLDIKGAGATSSTYALRVRNSSDVYSLQILDDTSVFNYGAGNQPDNTAFGYLAFTSNVNGDQNTAFGKEALKSNVSGSQNTVFGAYALKLSTSATNNTALGYAALNVNTGSSNTAVGAEVMKNNNSGVNNSAFGVSALFANVSGNGNAAYGNSALTNMTSGDTNSAFGREALISSLTADDNSGFGSRALVDITTGSRNTAVGRNSGGSVTTGTNNTFVGYNTSTTDATITNATALGNGAVIDNSNTMVFGNSSITNNLFYGKETLRNANVTWSANQLTAFGIVQSEVGEVVNTSISNGGYMIQGYSNHSAGSTSGLTFRSYVENNPTTNGGIRNVIFKHDGAGALTTIGDTNTFVRYYNNTTVTNSIYGDGSFVIGSTIAKTAGTADLHISKNITGAASTNVVYANGTILNDVTTVAKMFVTNPVTLAAAFTLTDLIHFQSYQNSTLGVGSAITNQYGFYADSNLTRATNNYGFYGNIASAANRWNLYMNGTADNYLAGNLGVGTSTISAKAHIISTTEQLRLGYDASNYFSTTVASNGLVTFNSVGAGSAFTFSDAVSLPASSTSATPSAGDNSTNIATTAFVQNTVVTSKAMTWFLI